MQYLREYQTFESVAELNKAVKSHRYANNFDLTNTDKDVLTIIAQHAAKYPGVAHLKAATIADKVGKSEVTVRRAINRLVNFGIIEKVPTLRKVSGGKGANILRILPYDQSAMTSRQHPETPHDNGVEAPKSQSETITPLSYENTVIKNNTYQADKPRRQSPYTRFKNFVENFVQDRKLTNRLYGIYLAQTNPLKKVFNAAELLEIALDAVKTAFMATKRKYNPVISITGYFNNTLDRMLDDLYFEAMEDFYENFSAEM